MDDKDHPPFLDFIDDKDEKDLDGLEKRKRDFLEVPCYEEEEDRSVDLDSAHHHFEPCSSGDKRRKRTLEEKYQLAELARAATGRLSLQQLSREYNVSVSALYGYRKDYERFREAKEGLPAEDFTSMKHIETKRTEKPQ